MYLPAIMASVHHLAAFTLVGALAVEVALFKPPLTVMQARRIQRADMVFGIAAGVLLVVGLLRVVYFEKGAGYYFANAFFLTKLSAFLAAGVISIYPTVLFLSWSKALREGTTPEMSVSQVRRARMCLMLELTAIAVILFCAPLMARGFGYWGAVLRTAAPD
jgi:putative membrane protein